MHQFLPYAWFGGRCVPFAEATLSVATHALHYGTGAFGGMRALPNPSDPAEILLFRADRHTRRLSQSARLLLTELPEETIHDAIVTFLRANKPTCPVYLRPFVYTSDLGIAPRLHNIETDFLIYGLELGDYLSPEGVSCRISSWTRQEDRSLPLRGKISGAYITSSLAKTEAVKSGFDEALLLNSRGKVSEASGMNLFIVRDGVLITPGLIRTSLKASPGPACWNWPRPWAFPPWSGLSIRASCLWPMKCSSVAPPPRSPRCAGWRPPTCLAIGR